MNHKITESAISDMLKRESADFTRHHPISRRLSEEASKNWLSGVPLHWMADWDLPFPLFIAKAKGASVTDVDGKKYIDFCLGDTAALFGHSPEPVVRCLAEQAASGLTVMLPSETTVSVGQLLQKNFHLPIWQVTTTASDANRALLRWSRAVTGRDKILVFNHAYHGAVDETFAVLEGDRIVNDPSLVGEPRELSALTKVVEFNDVAALEAALKDGDVACVLAEPIMTNAGMVLPQAGFHEKLRELTKKYGTLLILDETHCVSSGPSGYSGEQGLKPDALVIGKAIAGGVPAAVYGVSQEFNERIKDYQSQRQPGHSGIGTTLSGSKLQVALIETVLKTYFNEEVFSAMIALARKLEKGLSDTIIKHQLAWHVVRAGARVEFMCSPLLPRNGSEAVKVIHQSIDKAVHHYLLNHGIIMTPFHNMLLICPETTEADVKQMITVFDRCLTELVS